MRECEDRSHHLERASRPNPGAKWSQAQPWMRWGCREWWGCRSSTTSASWACLDISGYFWVFLAILGIFGVLPHLDRVRDVEIRLGTALVDHLVPFGWHLWKEPGEWESPGSEVGLWWAAKYFFFWKTWESTRQKRGWTNYAGRCTSPVVQKHLEAEWWSVCWQRNMHLLQLHHNLDFPRSLFYSLANVVPPPSPVLG